MTPGQWNGQYHFNQRYAELVIYQPDLDPGYYDWLCSYNPQGRPQKTIIKAEQDAQHDDIQPIEPIIYQDMPDYLDGVPPYLAFPDEHGKYDPTEPNNFTPSLYNHATVPWDEPPEDKRMVSSRQNWIDSTASQPKPKTLVWPPQPLHDPPCDKLFWMSVNPLQAHYRLAHVLSPEAKQQLYLFAKESSDDQPHSPFTASTPSAWQQVRSSYTTDDQNVLGIRRAVPAERSNTPEISPLAKKLMGLHPYVEPQRAPKPTPLSNNKATLLYHTARAFLPKIQQELTSGYDTDDLNSRDYADNALSLALHTIIDGLHDDTIHPRDLLSRATWDKKLAAAIRRRHNYEPSSQCRKHRILKPTIDPDTGKVIPRKYDEEIMEHSSLHPEVYRSPKHDGVIIDIKKPFLDTISSVLPKRRKEKHYALLQAMYEDPTASLTQLAKTMDVSGRTLYRWQETLDEAINNDATFDKIKGSLTLLQLEAELTQ